MALAHPLTRGMDLDDPETTRLRRRIIRRKPFLKQLYEEWYAETARLLPKGAGPVLELGTGAGFLKEFIPGLITSDIFASAGVNLVLDGQSLPFRDGGLRSIVMNNVLHHIPRVKSFFQEAARCVRPGGMIVMIEPWVTNWSKLIYGPIHHEPFAPEAEEWEFPPGGPLSGANAALPWIVFHRDRTLFEREFPEWEIRMIQPDMPFRYLLAGGISMRSLMPGWSAPLWRGVEACFQPWMHRWAMFARIVIERSRS